MSKQLTFKPHHRYELIEYPGLVVNTDKMLQTLGGLTKISRVLGDEQKRLELRYHPENPFNKAAYGESTQKSGVLLCVTVRRSKKNPAAQPKYLVRVLGHCKRSFVFETLCDFQYLPLYKPVQSSSLQYVLNKLKPQHVTDLDYFTRTDVPFFCLPEIFTRIDIAASGFYSLDFHEDGQHDKLGLLQKSTNDTRDIVPFSMTDAFPTNPDPQIVKRMKVKYVSDEQFLRIKKLFEEHPIWTRIALQYESGVSNDKLKCITPSLAFYFSTGPWRTSYVRYGYDPRKDFNARRYQTFDFRLRFGSGVSEFVTLKQKQAASDSKDKNCLIQDANYPYFDELKLPRSRQCILRYCDVRIQKIQDMLDKIPTPMTGAKCNERTGWLPPGFDTQVRQLLCDVIKTILRNHYRKENRNAEIEAVRAEACENQEDDYDIDNDTEDIELLDDFMRSDEINDINTTEDNYENILGSIMNRRNL